MDRGTRRGQELLSTLGREARTARRDRNLGLRAVAAALGVSPATVWRFENGRSPRASVLFVSQVLAVVGLELSARAFAGPTPLRDEGHAGLLAQFAELLHPSLGWTTEVPLPNPRDQRRWDGFVRGDVWRYGVEAETGPTDAQALAGRLELKRRDGNVDGVILVVPATRRVEQFLAAAQPVLMPHFPIPGADAVRRFSLGQTPGGSSLIVLRSTGRPVGRASRCTP